MRYSGIIFATALTAFTAGAAHAKDAQRYRLEKTDDGYVRMDTATGEMSICRERDGQLVCRMAADDRAAYADELDRVGNRLDALERRIAALETAGPAATNALPSDEELEQSLGLMEKFMRRFMGVMRDFEDETKETDGPLPDRT